MLRKRIEKLLRGGKSVNSRLLPKALLGSFFALSLSSSGGVAAESKAVTHFQKDVEPILAQYCYDCHADGMDKGQVAFDGFESKEKLIEKRELWLAVLKNVRAGVMPPEKKPRPTEKDLAVLESWIKSDVFKIDPASPDPGRVTLRRLNRAEYRNTIRDLMDIEFRTDEEFPADDTGYGFDTIGDVLTVSPLLLEKYMLAAETIVGRSVPTVTKVVHTRHINGGEFRDPDTKANGNRLTFYKEAKTIHKFKAEIEGDYRVNLNLEVDGAFDFDPGRATAVFKIDGEERYREDLKWEDGRKINREYTLKWSPGEHVLTVELYPLVPEDQKKTSVDLQVRSVVVEGPLAKEHWVHPPKYERFFARNEPPTGKAERRQYAQEILTDFTTKAFRRPVDKKSVERLTDIAEETYSQPGTTFEVGVSRAMVAVLASPRFIFRVEDALAGDKRYPLVDEYALASRLSYFLWSTMPDEELFKLAQRGELRKNLGAQTERMLKSERADALTKNFVGQWLQARDIEGVPINGTAIVRGDGKRGRFDFEAKIRQSMRKETEMYFDHIVRNDRSLLELIDSDYTFLNGTLAEHYGIPDVKGDEMRRVSLAEGSPRGGILTHGTVLAVTSNPTRTSPVKRGLFILDNILGTPAPPPPPDIPELEEAAKEFKDREPTVREMMQIHRDKPLCSSCHSRMDPLGLALENFNAMGQWRETEREQPVDASGKLITGETFAGIRELKVILKEQRRADFYRCITEKMLIYALGRGLEYYDVQTVDQIVSELERNEGRFSTLLWGVIESAPFQKRRSAAVMAAATTSSEKATVHSTSKSP